jgi:hypothetical protein
MPPVPGDKLTPAQKKTVDEYRKAPGGEPGGGYYTMIAMLLNTARTPLAPGVPAPLPAFP